MLMKRKLLLLPLLLLCLNAHALILSIDGYGNVPEEGLDTTVTETEIDILSGEPVMKLEGSLLASSSLMLTIDRSAAGLSDEFCCGGSCTSGNGDIRQILNFTSGQSSWFAHYYPASNSDITITYTFYDGADTRVIRVRYVYSAEGLKNLPSADNSFRKVLKDGILYIVNDSKTYTIL